MTSERSKKKDKAIRTDQVTTPESATSLEKERLDDDAVEKAVTVDRDGTGPSTILPGPPISPKTERRIERDMVREDSKSSQKKLRRGGTSE